MSRWGWVYPNPTTVLCFPDGAKFNIFCAVLIFEIILSFQSMSTQSDSDGSNEERYERAGLEGAGQGSQGAGQGSQGAEQLGEEARLNSKEMSAKLAAKELETLQVNCYPPFVVVPSYNLGKNRT